MEMLAAHTSVQRQTKVSLRCGQIEVVRPDGPDAKGQSTSVSVRLIEVIQRDAPTDVEPLHWRLLTTHEVADAQMAWQIV
jgi:hypothetical protein